MKTRSRDLQQGQVRCAFRVQAYFHPIGGAGILVIRFRHLVTRSLNDPQRLLSGAEGGFKIGLPVCCSHLGARRPSANLNAIFIDFQVLLHQVGGLTVKFPGCDHALGGQQFSVSGDQERRPDWENFSATWDFGSWISYSVYGKYSAG